MIIPLWQEPHEASHGQETVVPEIGGAKDVRLVRNVTVPSLTVHAPAPSTATGTGVIVCPGGSFATLTHGTGTAVATRLAEHGLTAFVLRYRLLPTPEDDDEFLHSWSTAVSMEALEAQSRIAKADALDAVRVVREQSSTWDIDRIGIMGFSAGGLLTVHAATGYSPESRPDFAVPVYAAVFDDYTVPADAPPLFLAFASDDEGPNVVESNLSLYSAWRAAGRSVEMHVYAEGGHSFGWRLRGLPCDTWLDRCLDWLHSQRPGRPTAP
ncbi:alpha/beta hydrolase [Actinomadura sp. NPDC047616]|uniref:alpha/beta hydrolase n=1 Tax=Actinomadura sp. NPDC047616 TaxID=3155914 RepID=UPI00341189B9